MKLLQLLTWPYVRKHKLRMLLTLAGVMLGVAVFVGMHTANMTIQSAFQRTVDRIAGKSQLQVTAGETGFPEEVLERVQSLRELSAASPVIEAALATPQGTLLVLGVDMTGDTSLREYDLEGEDEDVIDDPLIFLAQPDSLIVSGQFAKRTGLKRGSKLTLKTMGGQKTFTIRGVMKSTGLATVFGGNLAIMDIYAAQAVFGRGRLFDRVDIGLAEGITVKQARQKLQTMLGSGFQVEPPEARGTHFESMVRGLTISINMASLFALMIGVFIIYNSFSIAITQRRGEIGVLRALGATRGQVQRLFLLESIVLGLAGSCIGVFAGLAMARGIVPGLAGTLQEVFGHALSADQITVSPQLFAFAVVIGVLASLVGGYIPAHSAARVDPVKALQKGRIQVMSEGENRLRRLVASMCVVASAGLIGFGRTNTFYYPGYVLGIVSLVLLSPSMSMWLARAIRPALKRVWPVEGALAADSLIQAPRRTSSTVTALMLSLALAVGFAGVSRAIYDSLLVWMNHTLNPDLYVSPSRSITAKTFRFPGSMGDELRAIEGVEEVQPVRNARVMIGGQPVMAVALNIADVADRVAIRPVEGDREEMVRLGAAGKGVVISDSLSLLRNIHRGDILEIPTPRGPLRLPVLGSTIDYSDQQGTFLISRDLYQRYWGDDTANLFRIHVKRGVDREKVRQAILRRWSESHEIFVYTNQGIREYILKLTDQWFGLTYIQLAVALLVAILGIVNTLTVSITDRRRELGVLQAVGGLRNQIRRTIWLEAVSIGAVGLVMGAGAGVVMILFNLHMLRGDLGGLRVDFTFPYAFMAVMVPVVGLCSFISALWPAEAAVRASLVESLEYE